MIFRGPNTHHGRGSPVATGNKRIAIWGQSNAIGQGFRSELSSSPLSSDSGLAAYDAGTFSRVYIWTGSAYENLTPATNNLSTTGRFGAEFGLAVRWMRETASGNLYLEKNTLDGQSITQFESSLSAYLGWVTERSQGDAWLSSNSVTASDAGWLWIQGESDYAQTQAWYETRLSNLLSARTASGFQDSATKIVLVQMAAGTTRYGAGVVAAKSAIAAGSPTNTYAPNAPNYMNADNLHQNARGQVQIGYDAYELIFGASHIAT